MTRKQAWTTLLCGMAFFNLVALLMAIGLQSTLLASMLFAFTNLFGYLIFPFRKALWSN